MQNLIEPEAQGRMERCEFCRHWRKRTEAARLIGFGVCDQPEFMRTYSLPEKASFDIAASPGGPLLTGPNFCCSKFLPPVIPDFQFTETM